MRRPYLALSLRSVAEGHGSLVSQRLPARLERADRIVCVTHQAAHCGLCAPRDL